VPVGTPLARIREASEPGERPRSETRPIEPDRGAGLRPAKPEPTEPHPDSAADRMRRSIALAMTRSNREIPHYHLWTTIDLERATRWLDDVNAERPVEERLLPGVLLLKATALALGKHPEFSAVWEDDRVRLREPPQLGVAISLRGGGLVVATLHDAATRSLDDLMTRLRDLTARARTGRLKSSELADSTITVTSLGDRGVEGVLGVIYPPQVALVGFGRLAERPLAIDGQVVARPAVTASLAADHRASDGHRGGLFLAAIDGLLQEPGKL
jgi:pyruvate dehydrogenase E2 component (dihydrolipoamide acetyltransferase)